MTNIVLDIEGMDGQDADAFRGCSRERSLEKRPERMAHVHPQVQSTRRPLLVAHVSDQTVEELNAKELGTASSIHNTRDFWNCPVDAPPRPARRMSHCGHTPDLHAAQKFWNEGEEGFPQLMERRCRDSWSSPCLLASSSTTKSKHKVPPHRQPSVDSDVVKVKQFWNEEPSSNEELRAAGRVDPVNLKTFWNELDTDNMGEGFVRPELAQLLLSRQSCRPTMPVP